MIEKALFGAGCFWGVEEHFRTINGVTKTEVGYSGGHTQNPTYESVCYENTDHAEVLLVEFDEDLISYELLVDEFWKCHDPTTLDRQGPDVGRQYRSVIYYYDYIQKISQIILKINIKKVFKTILLLKSLQQMFFIKLKNTIKNTS